MKPTAEDTAFHIDVNNLSPQQAVERLIAYSLELTASDLFFATNETHVAVSARYLGIPHLLSILPGELGRRCVSHIKSVAGMEASERRRPLDGRWIHEPDNGLSVDLRINTIPTLHGEDLTLRFLERDSKLIALEKLGMDASDQNRLRSLLSRPSGLILVTGPTGSGKTTTLYACLAHLNTGKRKINTIEDPIEYEMTGIRQSQVNVKAEVDFADLLRSVLRQAPDVIMVGEIRDPMTADIAVRAANSGHLVLATLHAPVAAGAVQSMLGLGVHPPFLASSLQGALVQRLVRNLCPQCKVPFDSVDSAMFDEVRPWLASNEGRQFYGPSKCSQCRMEGYGSRSGIFELLTVSKPIRKLIQEKQSMAAIRQKAVEEGMIPFRQAALLKVARGETSIDEVFRAIPSEYLDDEE
jgi:type II secretory ATPase GspE/PulE/Tfp pilus assembly ATPase PilB-like protein